MAATGHHVLYITCRRCGHDGTRLDFQPDKAPERMKQRLRCSVCGAKGAVEVRWVWTLDKNPGSEL